MDYFLGQLTKQIPPAAQILEKAVLDGNVIIEQNTRSLEGVVSHGPSYIGQNSIIGNAALVTNSVIGEGCVVGYGTEIKHCYIGDKCWFHQNCFGDSIIGNDCSSGGRMFTANLRQDERDTSVRVGGEEIDIGVNKLGTLMSDGVRTGINVSLMPGVRVGAGCFVGPHVCLSHEPAVREMALPAGDYSVANNAEKIGGLICVG